MLGLAILSLPTLGPLLRVACLVQILSHDMARAKYMKPI